MDQKQTQRITLDELAAMVQRNFDTVATTAQLDRLEGNVAKLLLLVEALPEKIADKLLDVAALQRQVTELRRVVREKLGVEL